MQKLYIAVIPLLLHLLLSAQIVKLYNDDGLLLKAWTMQIVGMIYRIPAGIYHLKIEMKDGTHYYNKISK